MFGVLEIVCGILIALVSLLIIFTVVLQQGRRAGINGAISGGADTFLSKNKARTMDAKLPRFTRALAVLFFVLVVLAGVFGALK